MADQPEQRPELSSPPTDFSDPTLLILLERGRLSLEGLLPWSSNYAFLGHVSKADQIAPVVYKPMRGERPLWDFPRGTLAKRETAAFVVSQHLGWNLVPPTVLRQGPHGIGSVQLFVNVNQELHFFTFHEDPAFRMPLQCLALFDVISNNADRKGGHCLRLDNERIVAIDQGLCFNVEPKLRTVIWDFAGQPIPSNLVADLERFQTDQSHVTSPLLSTLAGLLSEPEIHALRQRLADLLASGVFPDPPEDRRPYPWPPV